VSFYSDGMCMCISGDDLSRHSGGRAVRLLPARVRDTTRRICTFFVRRVDKKSLAVFVTTSAAEDSLRQCTVGKHPRARLSA
jgi:hypothetical protein